jgi:acylphosphatase
MTEPAPPACVLARVEGRVQGVGFREACVQRAQALGLQGWVRNRRDGSVEVLVQGPHDQVQRLRDWLQRGPALARVECVTVDSQIPATDLAPDFERRATA